MQGGRDLLNQWTIVDGPHNHGTRAQARRGKLLIRVSWIVGMRPDEATAWTLATRTPTKDKSRLLTPYKFFLKPHNEAISQVAKT